MFHTYVLRSETTGRFCVGSTGDVQRRIAEHNAELASATKHRGPWRLVYSEEHLGRGAAMPLSQQD
jgi:predicted GIY-YIG superfamily endonuclease